MKLLPTVSFLVRGLLTGALAAPMLLAPAARAQAPAPATLDQQDAERAAAAVDAGKLEEAAGLYEGIPVKYPTSPLIPQATLKLGYVYFRMQQYDKAAKTLDQVTKIKNVPPEVAELALSLIPQVLSAKASAAGPKDPQRKRLFEDAVKAFDAFLQKYPKSDEVETANYGKAVALYQVERYDEALAPLRFNLTNFSKSDSVLDSQYLMALTMGTVANTLAAKETKPDPNVALNYDNAEKMLADITTKGDVALGNDSRFQIGEINFARAGFIKDTKENEKRRKELLLHALDVYRLVGGKEAMIAAQNSRVERLKTMKQQALVSRDAAQMKRLGRYLEKEQEKLETIKTRPDQTIAAKIKMGEIFFQLGQLDEARVMLEYTKTLVEEEEQKKVIAYYVALSLAQQNAETKAEIPALVERTEQAYNEFTAAYAADPIAENLALVVGSAFTTKDPAKAAMYLDKQIKEYPKSKLGIMAENLKGIALMNEEKYGEALEAFKATLAKNPERDIAAGAEFGIATVLQKQKNTKEAIPAFKNVRDKYAGTPQAEQAAFFYGQLLQETGNSKDALPELQKFIKDNPKSELMPTALYYLAQAQAALNQHAEAMSTYKRVATEFPQAEVAPFTYFQRAQLLMGDQKMDEVVPLMQEFMKNYPDKETLFQAYDFVAQIQTSQKKDAEAIGTYEDFAKLKPQDPMAAQALLQVGTKWKGLAEGLGRFLTLNEEQRATWAKDLDNSVNGAERVIRLHPDAPQVALALALLLDDYQLRLSAKMVTVDDIEKYFRKLAEEFKDKPSTHSKIVFTLAGYLIEKDKAKALALMSEVYDPKLKYAPEDMDLYATGLIDQKKPAEAVKVFTKLAADYAIPANSDPTKAPRDIQEAQSMSLFGLGKVLQDEGKVNEAKVKFDELEKLYGWSPKMLAANLGIAEALHAEKKYEDALKRLSGVIRASKAPADLRAKAMLLLARIHEDMGNYDDAISNYIKISTFYAGVPKIAAEGLWRGAQLLEKEATGQIAIPTPTPKPAPVKKPATPAAAAK